MASILWRIIIVVVVVVLLQAILPPLLRILGLSPSGDVLTVLRLCVVGLAVLYILTGPGPWPWRKA